MFWDSGKIHYDGEAGIGCIYGVKVVMVAYTTILPGGLYSSAIQPDISGFIAETIFLAI